MGELTINGAMLGPFVNAAIAYEPPDEIDPYTFASQLLVSNCKIVSDHGGAVYMPRYSGVVHFSGNRFFHAGDPNFRYMTLIGNRGSTVINGNTFGVGIEPGARALDQDPVLLIGCENVVFSNNIVQDYNKHSGFSLHITDGDQKWNNAAVTGNVLAGRTYAWTPGGRQYAATGNVEDAK
jgi:hypothetical protein